MLPQYSGKKALEIVHAHYIKYGNGENITQSQWQIIQMRSKFDRVLRSIFKSTS